MTPVHAHTSLPLICSTTTEQTDASRAGKDYFGADGNAIKNLGSQLIKGSDEGGRAIELKFDVAAKLTRPLASVFEMVQGDNEVVFTRTGGDIRNKAGRYPPLRCEGKLWFLDVWVEVPKSIANSPFARRISSMRTRL